MKFGPTNTAEGGSEKKAFEEIMEDFFVSKCKRSLDFFLFVYDKN